MGFDKLIKIKMNTFVYIVLQYSKTYMKLCLNNNEREFDMLHESLGISKFVSLYWPNLTYVDF